MQEGGLSVMAITTENWLTKLQSDGFMLFPVCEYERYTEERKKLRQAEEHRLFALNQRNRPQWLRRTPKDMAVADYRIEKVLRTRKRLRRTLRDRLWR